MTFPHARRLLVVLLAAVALFAAACGDDGAVETSDLPADDDAPLASGTCLEGTVDCVDTAVDVDPPVLEPGDDENPPPEEPIDLPDSDGVLSPEDAVALGTSDGQVSVSGSYFDDGTGARLCGALAESFPPQCGGEALLLQDLDVTSLDVVLASSEGVTWSDELVTLSGTLVDGVLMVADIE